MLQISGMIWRMLKESNLYRVTFGAYGEWLLYQWSFNMMKKMQPRFNRFNIVKNWDFISWMIVWWTSDMDEDTDELNLSGSIYVWRNPLNDSLRSITFYRFLVLKVEQMSNKLDLTVPLMFVSTQRFNLFKIPVCFTTPTGSCPSLASGDVRCRTVSHGILRRNTCWISETTLLNKLLLATYTPRFTAKLSNVKLQPFTNININHFSQKITTNMSID